VLSIGGTVRANDQEGDIKELTDPKMLEFVPDTREPKK
jgi:hypothetical protein